MVLSGEPGGTRTRDPVLKRHMLYRLSYRPKLKKLNYLWLTPFSQRRFLWGFWRYPS